MFLRISVSQMGSFSFVFKRICRQKALGKWAIFLIFFPITLSFNSSLRFTLDSSKPLYLMQNDGIIRHQKVRAADLVALTTDYIRRRKNGAAEILSVPGLPS